MFAIAARFIFKSSFPDSLGSVCRCSIFLDSTFIRWVSIFTIVAKSSADNDENGDIHKETSQGNGRWHCCLLPKREEDDVHDEDSNDYYENDPILQTLTGRKNGLVYRLGQQIKVRLDEANPLTGGLILSLSEVAKKIKKLQRI